MSGRERFRIPLGRTADAPRPQRVDSGNAVEDSSALIPSNALRTEDRPRSARTADAPRPQRVALAVPQGSSLPSFRLYPLRTGTVRAPAQGFQDAPFWRRLCRFMAVALAGGAALGAPADLLQPPKSLPVGGPKLVPLLVNNAGSAISNRSGWLAQRESLRRKWLDFLGDLPAHKAPLKAEVSQTEQCGGFTRQLVRYQIEEGIFTDAYLLKPARRQGRYPAVVVFHPTIATAAAQVAGVDSSVPEKMQGVHLALRGYVVLCPRCYIFAEGAGYSNHVQSTLTKHPAWKGMTRMLWDGVRAADYLESLPYVDKTRLGCLGHSLGAKEALYAAAFDERFKTAVFSEGGIGIGFSNWEAIWYLGGAVKEPGFALEHHQLMALIAPRAFLLLGGESADGDKSWPFIEATLPVYKLLGAPGELGWLNHRSGHRYPPEARAVAEEFIDRRLRP